MSSLKSTNTWEWQRNVVGALLTYQIHNKELSAEGLSSWSYNSLHTPSLLFYSAESHFYQATVAEFKSVFEIQLLHPTHISNLPHIAAVTKLLNYKHCICCVRADKCNQCTIQFPIFIPSSAVQLLNKCWNLKKWDKNIWLQYFYQPKHDHYQICENLIFTSWYQIINLTEYILKIRVIKCIKSAYCHRVIRRMIHQAVIEQIQRMDYLSFTIKNLANYKADLFIAFEIHQPTVNEQKQYFRLILKRLQKILQRQVNATVICEAVAIKSTEIDFETNMNDFGLLPTVTSNNSSNRSISSKNCTK
eukprot:355488_1